MLTASHDNVLTVLKTETNVHLLLCPFSDVIETPVEHISANTKHVNLSPNANGFGLCVATSAESKYPFIERIKDKGAAAEHPKIATGDFIIEVKHYLCTCCIASPSPFHVLCRSTEHHVLVLSTTS